MNSPLCLQVDRRFRAFAARIWLFTDYHQIPNQNSIKKRGDPDYLSPNTGHEDYHKTIQCQGYTVLPPDTHTLFIAFKLNDKEGEFEEQDSQLS